MSKQRKDRDRFLKTPQYAGGLKAMRQFVAENLKYPKAALDGKIEGTVAVKYDINYKGKVTDAKVTSGIGHGCDEEAIRIVKLFQFSAPRNHKKMRVLFHRSIKIHFRLPKQKPVAKPKVPAPPTTVQYTYTKASPKKQVKTEKKKSGTYSYTIQI